MKHFNGQTMPSNQTTNSTQTPETPPSKTELSNILGEPFSREQVLTLLHEDPKTYRTFQGFPQKEQEKLLSFMEGNRGLQITYDSFFKKIMDPETHPERLENFLSAVLNQKVRIRTVLPHEGIKLSSSGSLVIMDIVLELADGSIADVEMQKIGYAFPGERGDCEDSSKEFKTCSPHYVHHKQTTYNSGASVTNLSNIVYISLDTFHNTVHNINTELDAWLTFLSSDSPNDIIKLVTAFPKFREYYQDIVNFRKHPEELIYMYSEALLAVDRNTVQYMVDELKNELVTYQNELEQANARIAELEAQLKEQNLSTNE